MKLKYPYSTVVLLVIIYLSFFTPPSVPVDDVPGFDKLVHTAMYGGLCLVMWAEYFHLHDSLQSWKGLQHRWRFCPIRWNRCWLGFVAFPILFSGAIELLQEYCTNHRRSGDWWDLAANSLGVLLVLAFVALCHKKNPQSSGTR